MWESADYKKKNFGFKNVAKYNFNAFFFQLVATGILTFNWINANKNVVCVFGKDDNNMIKYKVASYWKGICFRKAGHSGGRIDYASVFNRK